MANHLDDADATAAGESDGRPADGEASPSPAGTGPDGETDEEINRRRLVKYLIVVAIAVPLLVEGFTFLGLVGDHFGSDGDGGAGAGTATATEVESAVGEGDELLAETNQTETLTTATLRETDGGRWTLTLTVTVDNTGERPYGLELGTVEAGDGREYDASTSTGRLEPGESGTVSAQWSLPGGSLPDRLTVTTVEYGDEPVRTERTVELENVPVER